jgi:tetratricopeptide (TPR) repeat protein
LYAAVAADRGQTAKAVAAADAMLDAAAEILPTNCPWCMVNAAVDVYVNAGCYGKALGAADRWTSSAQDLGRASDAVAHAFVQINRAEALHNLGRQSEALALLDEAEPAAQASPLAKHGLRLLRVWIFAHGARPEEAKVQLASVEADALGLQYAAEYHFTRAMVDCAGKDFIAAERAARQGQLVARRASSKRNALHVLARVAFATGDMQRTIALLEQARGHRYKGQSGPVLALLGEAYEAAGKIEDARGAYAGALSLDPESTAAEKARARIDFLNGVPLPGVPLPG